MYFLVVGSPSTKDKRYLEVLIKRSLKKLFDDEGVDDELLSTEMIQAVSNVLNTAKSDGLPKRRTRAAIEAVMKVNGIAEEQKPGKLAHALYGLVMEGLSRESLRVGKVRTIDQLN